ncbi:PP2C family protein-serine/threonine phosphatase [Allokutzneria albata]|uniref:Serine phosphatase RsbU, regulator of sigma subunit n=1 Tax=Allokutzneria albata TaxID=211114 RepID=A0A1H0CEH0_ALLAB|nr:SpoIIE family protein phosphatase [Allokutzneria albata]SDN56161.1 Serine phosphatase RsbU, regulator of sigma subunit [Allokutzneria albata]
MSPTSRTDLVEQRVGSEADAALLREKLLRVLAQLPVDDVHRAELLVAISRELRDLVDAGGGTVRIAVEDLPEESPVPVLTAKPERLGDEALLGPLLAVITEQRQALSWHQTELQQTNAGLLALHAELEQQRRRLTFLDEISRMLVTSLAEDEVLQRLVQHLVRAGFAETATAWVPVEEALSCTATTEDEIPRMPSAEVVAAARAHRAHAGSGLLALPFLVGNQCLGVLELRREQPDYDEDEHELGNHVAGRAAVALRNAREYERERDLAETLQRAMLPALPQAPGIRVCARYRPATRGINVGGDWFDAFIRPDGRLVLTVGDVTGHGIDAALMMGQLQKALRAYAIEGHGPAATLRLVHQLMRTQETGLLATAVLAELDPDSGALRWAGAGHLPMALRARDGSATLLTERQAPLLGLPLATLEVPEHSTVIEPGGGLLLYTDGLVERRHYDIDTGLRRLVDAFSADPGIQGEPLVRSMLADLLTDSRHEDDMCLLLCERVAPENPDAE